jgi:hypothetical protein
MEATMMRKAIVAGTVMALILAGVLADARGLSFPVQITSFSRTSPDAATFVLVGVPEDVVPGCPTVTVRAHYALSTSFGRQPFVSRKAHTAALDQFQREYERRAETRFCIIGTGLGEDPNGGTCHFTSRALAIAAESDGTRAVYSYFKLP